MKLEPQHQFDECLGGGGGMEVWRCVRCQREAFPTVFGGFWPNLARWIPFAGRWRCRPRKPAVPTKIGADGSRVEVPLRP